MMATRKQVKPQPSGKAWTDPADKAWAHVNTRPLPRQPQPTFRSVYRKDARAFR
jgi:hypothetical protein